MTTQSVAEDVPQFQLHHRLALTVEDGRTTVPEMAEILEVSHNTIWNYTGGRTRPRPKAVKEWAVRCGVPFTWLMYGIEPTELGPERDTLGVRVSRCTEAQVLPFPGSYEQAAA